MKTQVLGEVINPISITTLSPPEAPVLESPEDGSVRVYNWDHYSFVLDSYFHWSASEGAIDYEFELNGPENVLDTVISNVAQYSLLDGEYTWRVRARNQAGYSGWSQIWSFSKYQGWPHLPTLVAPADESTIALASDSTCTFSWIPSDQSYVPADVYEIDIIGPVSVNGEVTGTSFTVTLSPGEYEWFVTPHNEYFDPTDYNPNIYRSEYWSFTVAEPSATASPTPPPFPTTCVVATLIVVVIIVVVGFGLLVYLIKRK